MSGSGTPLPASPRAMCTYVDSHYLSRGIVAIRRLLEHDPGFRVHVLCFDEAVAPVLDDVFGGRVVAVPLAELHAAEPRIPHLRADRTPWEFIATHKAAFMLHVMTARGPFEWVSFIDADTASYQSVGPVFVELAGSSIGVSPHRFPADDVAATRFGVFNAGFICVRDDTTGRRCLREWSEDCIGWCREQPQADGRFMNQGYLTAWPHRYPAVAVIRHPGANLAPWNLGSHTITYEADGVRVDGEPLLFFHFSALARQPDGTWITQHADKLRPWPEIVTRLYKPYLAEVGAVERQLLARHGLSGTGSVRFDRSPSPPDRGDDA